MPKKQKSDTEKKYEKDEIKRAVKEKLRELMVEKSGQGVVKFPEFEVEIYQEEVIVHFTFVDIVSPFAYFVKPEKETRDKTKPDHQVPARTEAECAEAALKEDTSSGYEFCNGDKYPEPYCDLLDEKKLGLNKTDSSHCVIRLKIEGKELNSYKTTLEKIEDIQSAAKSQSLKVTYGTKELVFEQLHFIAEESEIDRSKLYDRKIEHKKISKEKSLKTLGTAQGILNLQSCFEACSDPGKGFACDTFSLCKSYPTFLTCDLVELNNQNVADDDADYFEEDKQCHVYTVSSAAHFEKHEGKKLKDENQLLTFDDTKDDECARNCLNYNQEEENKEKCLSVEICISDVEKKTCRLSSKQTLWKGDEEVVYQEGCNVYSVKHLVNFYPTTKEKLTDFVKEYVESIDQCATACSVGNCKKFNYCEREGKSECRYVSEGVIEDPQNTGRESDELGCVTYARRDDFIADLTPGSPQVLVEEKAENRNSGKGFKRGSVTGFVFLFLFIGMFVGAGGLYAKKRYLSGGGSDGGENATITFSNLNRENDE